MEAIQQDNCNVRFTHVASATKDGVVGGDGVEVKVDTIVCATGTSQRSREPRAGFARRLTRRLVAGFDVSFRPRFPVIGRNGVDLREKWKVAAEGYLGVSCADMPNWVCFLGPNW